MSDGDALRETLNEVQRKSRNETLDLACHYFLALEALEEGKTHYTVAEICHNLESLRVERRRSHTTLRRRKLLNE